MAEGKYANQQVEMSAEQQKARRSRNIAIAIVLALFVGLLYWVTLAKLGTNIMNRSL